MTPRPVDLHVHSTASDGALAPEEVVRHAAAAKLDAIALTDHDTLQGLEEARAAGARSGVRVVAGCEFSVSGPGGEMHLLGYFLPPGDDDLERFLRDQRDKRQARAEQIVIRLQRAGVRITLNDLERFAGRSAVGRPHLARAVVACGAARDINDAFDRYLATGRLAFVPKELPPVRQVTALVRDLGGVTSAAHLKDRGVRPVLTELARAGLDGVEVLHPSHDPGVSQRIARLAAELKLLPTGGSDWHGDFALERPLAALGGMNVPAPWLEQLESLHAERTRAEVS